MIFFAFIVAFKAFYFDMTFSAFITKFYAIILFYIMAWLAIIAVILIYINWKIIAFQTDIICHLTLTIFAICTRTLNAATLSAFNFNYLFLSQLMNVFFSCFLFSIFVMALFARENFVADIAYYITVSPHIMSANFC